MSSKVTIKKNLIILHKDQWFYIYKKIMNEFGKGMAVRTRLRRELGFSYRYHQELVNLAPPPECWTYYEQQVHLAFYSEQAQTWFILRYINKDTAVDQ